MRSEEQIRLKIRLKNQECEELEKRPLWYSAGTLQRTLLDAESRYLHIAGLLHYMSILITEIQLEGKYYLVKSE